MNLLNKVVTLETEASDFGFQWETPEQIMAQIHSECIEISEHLDSRDEPATRPALQEEIGDLMHAVFSLCVFCKLDPSETLAQTLDKFERRLLAVKDLAKEQGLSNLQGVAFDELMMVWKEAKLRVG